MRITALFISTLCLAGWITAQTLDRYTVRSWNVEDGLPQSSVRCIAQTTDGYLWAGTWNGLARFDGIRFTTYRSGNTPALGASNILSLFTDGRGVLWIGTDGGGLTQYAEGEFLRFDSSDGLTARRILSIDEDDDGRLWLATESGVFVGMNGRFIRFTEEDGLPATYANQIIRLKHGRVYVGLVGLAAIVRLVGSELHIEETFRTGGRTVTADSSGSIWMVPRNNTVIRRADGREEVMASVPGMDWGVVYVLLDQSVWITSAKKLHLLSGRTSQEVTELGGIPMESVSCIFEDREGIIWLGKEGRGLIRLREKQVEMIDIRNGLGIAQVTSGFQDPDGRVWIATWGAGAYRSSATSTDRFERLPIPRMVESIPSVCRTSDGTVWFASWGHGLWSMRNDVLRQFVDRNIPPEISIVGLAPDANGGLWLATAHDGIRHVRGTIVRSWSTENGLTSNRVNSLLVAGDGTLWAGSSGGGVMRIVPTGEVSALRMKDGLLDDNTLVLREDQSGAIWIGSNRGLHRWKDGRIASLTERDGLHDETVSIMNFDANGDFWMGGTHGLFRVTSRALNDAADGKGMSISNFTLGKEDGMAIEELAGGNNTNSWRTRDGRLWFASTAGAVRVDPARVSVNPVPPGVIVEEAWVEHSAVPVNTDIIMRPGQTKVEIRYTGISFSAPHKIRFRYFLEGYDKSWKETGAQRMVQYTNLDPGEYTFRVIAANSTDTWNTDGASLRIVVLPPFWATWWFRGLTVLFFLSVGPFFYWRRVTGLQKEQARQREFSRTLIERQELERKRIAGELHDGLGQQLLVIKNRLLMSIQESSRSDTSPQPLAEISDVVSSAIEEVRSISHNLRPHQLDQLGLTKTLRAVCRQLRESSALIVDAQLDDIDRILGDQEEISLFRIVQEALNNVAKHSGASEARVIARRDPGSVFVEITDNGRGFNMHHRPNSEHFGTSFGLSGMAERARMFGWEFAMDSSEGRGTTVRVRIAMKEWKMEDGKG